MLDDHHPPPHPLLQGTNLKPLIRPAVTQTLAITLHVAITQGTVRLLSFSDGYSCGLKLIVSGVIWLFCGHTLISCRQKYNHWNVKTQWIHLVKNCSRNNNERRCLLLSCVLFDIWSIRKMGLNFNLTLNKIKEAIDSYEKISTHVLRWICIVYKQRIIRNLQNIYEHNKMLDLKQQ